MRRDARATALTTERVVEMLETCERLALVISAGIHGVRGGLPRNCWSDLELKALQSVVADLQMLSGRFIAEAKGEEYVAPTFAPDDGTPYEVNKLN